MKPEGSNPTLARPRAASWDEEPVLRVSRLTKSLGGQPILRGVSLTVSEARTVAVLGRSGSGKTTFLRIISGLERPDTGSVMLDGRDLARIPPARRGIVFLSQSPLLFPHLSLFENVAFGLRVRNEQALPFWRWISQVGRARPSNIKNQVEKLLHRLGIEDQADKLPHRLSGGQRQRAAFGRALLVRPRILLLDEPFGALDPDTRQSLQRLFLEVVRAERIATLFVTHDVREALIVGDRFAYLEDGLLKTYTSQREFIEDARVGAQAEMMFWRSFQGE